MACNTDRRMLVYFISDEENIKEAYKVIKWRLLTSVRNARRMGRD